MDSLSMVTASTRGYVEEVYALMGYKWPKTSYSGLRERGFFLHFQPTVQSLIILAND